MSLQFELVLTFPRSNTRFATQHALPVDAGGVAVTDEKGFEHHFGGCEIEFFDRERCVSCEYVATYKSAGEAGEFIPHTAIDGLEGAVEFSRDAELGPRLTPLALTALKDMANSCNQGNGVAFPYEKDEVVLTLLALQRRGEAPEPGELEIWAATNGWSVTHAHDIRELGEKALAGKSFRPAIRLANDQYLRYCAHWEQLAA